MISRGPALAGMTLAAALAITWRSGETGGRQLRYYDPIEYVARADRFITQGLLEADCSGEQPRIVPRLDRAPRAAREWYEESYLKPDVELFNEDPAAQASLFLIDQECKLRGVSRVAHRVALPFAESWPWLGSILFAGHEADAVLRSAERTVSLRRGDRPPHAELLTLTQVGASTDVAAGDGLLLHFRGGPAQSAATLERVGDDVVLTERTHDSGTEHVRLMGHLLHDGRRARLESGDWVHLEAARPTAVEETFVFVGGRALQVASAVRRRNDRYERFTVEARLGRVSDVARADQRPYLQLLADSIDVALQGLPAERAKAQASAFDLHLGLDRDVHLRLTRRLQDFCKGIAGRRGRPFAAGVTVLDGKTGDILALATHPSPEALQPLRLEDRVRRRLLTNQNLLRHPIGSAGKPFLYAAVAHVFPLLMQMQVDAHPSEEQRREVLQCELDKGYLVHGSPASVDFPTALKISSNRYTVELVTLALAADTASPASTLEQLVPRDTTLTWPTPGHSSGVRVAGRALDYAPKLGKFLLPAGGAPSDPTGSAVRRCQTLSGFEQVAFREPLEALTGAETYSNRTPADQPDRMTGVELERGYRTAAYDLRVWSPLLRRLFEGTVERERWQVRAALQGVSPARVNLAFNKISQFRGDYVSLLLGGGSSTWTNVQLAEALARLVTGRRVQARLARAVTPRGKAEPVPMAGQPALVNVREAARAAVLEGMARVATSGGTAELLERDLAALRQRFPGEQIDLYAKTGTPTLEVRARPGLARALEALLRRSRLAVDGNAVCVRRRDGSTRACSRDATAFESALAEALVELARTEPIPPPAVRWADDVADIVQDALDARETRSVGDGDVDAGPLAIDGGGLRLDRDHPIFRDRSLPGRPGAVLILAMVRRPAGGAPYPSQAELTDPRSRVIVVALHLETGPNSKIAVQAAHELMPELAQLLN